MPSFAIHSVCGIELLKKLNITPEQKNEFIIGNVLPDVSRIKNFKLLSENDQRREIQIRKKKTHFRKKNDEIIEYPDCEIFVQKYENEIKNNISTLAYFFHLYTDYYFYKKFLRSVITFYDEKMIETDKKHNVKYVKVNKNNNILDVKEFFNKKSEDGVYKEYSRSNNFLLKKYNIKIDCDDLIQYIDDNGFLINVNESNSLYAYYAIIKLKKYVNDIKDDDCELKIFEEKELIDFVEKCVKSFCDEYDFLIENFKE